MTKMPPLQAEAMPNVAQKHSPLERSYTVG